MRLLEKRTRNDLRRPGRTQHGFDEKKTTPTCTAAEGRTGFRKMDAHSSTESTVATAPSAAETRQKSEACQPVLVESHSAVVYTGMAMTDAIDSTSEMTENALAWSSCAT